MLISRCIYVNLSCEQTRPLSRSIMLEDFNDNEDTPATINMQSVHSLHGSITAMNQILEILCELT